MNTTPEYQADIDREAARYSFGQIDDLVRHVAHQFTAQPIAIHPHQREHGVHRDTWHVLDGSGAGDHVEIARRIRHLLANDSAAVQSDPRTHILRAWHAKHLADIDVPTEPRPHHFEGLDLSAVNFRYVDSAFRHTAQTVYVDDPAARSWQPIDEGEDGARAELGRRAAIMARQNGWAFHTGEVVRLSLAWCKREGLI